MHQTQTKAHQRHTQRHTKAGRQAGRHTHTHVDTHPPVSLNISLLKAVSKLVAALEQVGVEHILQLCDSRLLLHTLPTHPHHLLLHMHYSRLALVVVTQAHSTRQTQAVKSHFAALLCKVIMYAGGQGLELDSATTSMSQPHLCSLAFSISTRHCRPDPSCCCRKTTPSCTGSHSVTMMMMTGVTVLYSSQANLQLLEPWSQVSKLLPLHSRQVVVQLSAQLSLVLLYTLLQLLYVALHRLQPRLLLLQLLA